MSLRGAAQRRRRGNLLVTSIDLRRKNKHRTGRLPRPSASLCEFYVRRNAALSTQWGDKFRFQQNDKLKFVLSGAKNRAHRSAPGIFMELWISPKNYISKGERCDRRQRRIKGAERVAAVDKIEEKRKPEDFIGHRNRAIQQCQRHCPLNGAQDM